MCAALSVLHATFFLSEHVPEVSDLVTSHYGEMSLVILTVPATIYGCKLYNGNTTVGVTKQAATLYRNLFLSLIYFWR